MACDSWIIIKVFLLILSLACLILKRITDYDASRLFFLLEKLSYEWPLLNNVTWDENGATFVDITYGGFVVICIGLLVAAACGELRRKNSMETFFLVVGGLMFAAAGALILAALDQVPHQLIDYAAALGTLSLVTALLFFIDFALSSRRRKKYKPKPLPPPVARVNNATQTLDQKSYVGPLFVTKTETPIHRFHSSDHTTPKWVGDEEPAEMNNGGHHQDHMMQATPPPAGFMHDAPTRGFVLRTAQNWPRVVTPKPPTKTAVTRSTSTETLDEDISFHPHTVEITTETPRSVINTKVLHRWLNQKREMNGTNLI